MSKATLFVINDYFGHGGHVKSFLAHLESIKTNEKIYIICAKDGYLSNYVDIELKRFSITYLNMSNLRKFQFSYNLYVEIKKLLTNNMIINIYSYECYFSILLAKTYFKNISIINSVMGGPNPFPLLDSTDIYIAVSEEQKRYVLDNAYGKNVNEIKIRIIKNRIQSKSLNLEINMNNKYILIVSRFDKGLKPSLENIVQILKNIPNDIPVKIAGTGEIIYEYKELFKNCENIEFLGYCKDLDKLRENACVVLGMGRSILESLLNGKVSILVGYAGIEILEDLETVSFASDYNFAGRYIKLNTDITTTVKKIVNYYESNFLLDKKVIEFLDKEYSIEHFNEKYENIINNIQSHKVSRIQVLFEYLYIFFLRLKRKFIK